MAGSSPKILLLSLLLLGSARSAQAFGGRLWHSNWSSAHASYYYSYYYPVPVYFMPMSCPSALTIPVQPALPMPMARPVPAPPSGPQSQEPPLSSPKKAPPTIIEARSLGSVHAQGGTAKERCKVGFWNVTGRDITLNIDGQPRLLAKDRAITLDLERAFVWRIDQGDPNSERVPEDQAFHEVILRPEKTTPR